MKISKIFSGLILGCAFAASLTGCEADYEPDYDRIFFAQAASSSVNKLQVDKDALETKLTVRLVAGKAQDVKATIAVNESLIQAYNEVNGSNYKLLPAEYYTLNKDVVITAGTVSVDVPMQIKPFKGEEQYALAFSLEHVEGPVVPSEKSSNIVILLDKPLIQSVPETNYRHVPASDSDKKWGLKLTDWSLEGWIWKDDLSINNQAVFDPVSNPEIYVRFGDTSIPYNTLQVKFNGSQVNNPTEFETSKWYHLAITYSLGDQKLTIYVNGEKTGDMTSSCPEMNIDGLSVWSSSQQYNRGKGRMAQVRLWGRCLADNEIKANMFTTVATNANALKGYWKMNEGQGKVYKDCTGNGFDLICKMDPAWIADVRFDGK